MNTITEYRTGRNFIRVGDTVKVSPTKPGGHDGFRGKIVRIDATADNQPAAIHLCVTLTANGSDRHRQAGKSRVVTPDRVTRCRQPQETP